MEANLFAASLLMPAEFLENDIQKCASTDLLDDAVVHRLAKRYDVSSQALVLRLSNLGYIE